MFGLLIIGGVVYFASKWGSQAGSLPTSKAAYSPAGYGIALPEMPKPVMPAYSTSSYVPSAAVAPSPSPPSPTVVPAPSAPMPISAAAPTNYDYWQETQPAPTPAPIPPRTTTYTLPTISSPLKTVYSSISPLFRTANVAKL